MYRTLDDIIICMTPKVRERDQVIALRKKGYSYREILKEVPVSKSSISLWLKDSPLTDVEKKILSSRRNADISRWRLRAAASRRVKWEKVNQELYQVSKEEFDRYVGSPFFQLGLALYWAEGAKRNTSFAFTNSDVEMVRIMIRWMETFLGVSKEDMHPRLYLHKPYAHENCEEYWAKFTGLPLSSFRKTIYKPTSLLVKKRPNYKGCIRIGLGKVSHLRKLIFWQQLIIEHYRKAG